MSGDWTPGVCLLIAIESVLGWALYLHERAKHRKHSDVPSMREVLRRAERGNRRALPDVTNVRVFPEQPQRRWGA